MPITPQRRLDGALLLFGLLALTQAGHLLEHLVQVIQWDVLGLSGDDAGGLLRALDTEWVHYLWNTLVIAATIPLVLRHRSNRWLWLALFAAGWHQVEHSYLIFQYVQTAGLPGDPGLLATGGAIAGGVPASRVDLHFFYNLVEVVPLFIAFAQVVRDRDRRAPAPIGRALAASTAGAVLVSAALIGTAAITAPDDYDGKVLAAYAADFPLPLAAPTFVPDGFHLVDGDGPWTELDLDGDGRYETNRAELMYAPQRHRGVAPLMLSMETQHDLSTLAGGYDQVRLPSGEWGWLSQRPDSPWSALLWNRDGLTLGIQAEGLTRDEILRIAASMTIIPEA